MGTKDTFLRGITDIHFVLYACSWGRLQCNATTYDDKKYHSWTGRPNEDLSLELFVDAIKLIDEQVQLHHLTFPHQIEGVIK